MNEICANVDQTHEFGLTDLNDIIYCKAESNYTRIHFKNFSIITTKVLKHFESILPSDTFIRIHKSYLVNIDYISCLTSQNLLKLKTELELPIARRRKSRILKLLSKDHLIIKTNIKPFTTSPGGVSCSFVYDGKGRVTSISENIPGTSPFSTTYTYDDFGRNSTITHPSGITETNNYNSNGYLSSVSAGGTVRWMTTGMNARQQVTSGQYGSNLSATFRYDAYSYPVSSVTGTIQDYSYNFNPVTGNLNWRQNNKYSGMKEDFHYDNLDRLDDVYMGTTQTLDMTYDSNKGGITTKSDLGTMIYNTPGKPYAVSSIDPSTGLIPSPTQSITYTSFNSVSSIAENNYSATFTYNPDNERAKMDIRQNDNSILTRWYIGSGYIKETVGSLTKEYTFIGGNAYSAPVVAITQSGATTYYDLLRDYLGNITHVVDAGTNSLVAEYSFDA